MKFFDSTLWQTMETKVFSTEALFAGLTKYRKAAAPVTAKRDIPHQRSHADDGPVAYALTPDFVRSFATSGLPFLTFYEFNTLSGWCRDMAFAPDHVDNYAQEVCQSYNVWTQKTTNAYQRHIFLDSLAHDLTISFDVPFLDTLSWFPLHIRLYDDDGLYFRNDQKLVVENLSGARPNLTSWKKIPSLAKALPRLHSRSIKTD